MIYRLAANEDLDQMMAMVDQAKASFKARGIDSGRRGSPDREGLAAGAAKGQIRVLEEDRAGHRHDHPAGRPGSQLR